jgi:FAD:protein FMN transferase
VNNDKKHINILYFRHLHFTSPLTPYSSLLSPHLLIPLLLFLLAACSDDNSGRPLEFTGTTMGTHYSVMLMPPYSTTETDLHGEIGRILEDINAKMSTWRDDSELSLLNDNDSQDWITVSSELYTVLAIAQQISEKTSGAFDITVGASVNQWGFGPTTISRQPDPAEIIAAMQATGFRKLELSDTRSAIKKYPGSYLDLSGIAKGYAVDRIADYLQAEGIGNYLVEIGGEIRAHGKNQRNDSWRVGIERPQFESRNVRDIIALDNTGMATSGGYRNFIIYDGKRYSHTIDPKTGWPVTHNLTSVSVLDISATVADALATALLVMGPDDGHQFAERENIPALFIVNENGTFTEKYTTSFLPYLVK